MRRRDFFFSFLLFLLLVSEDKIIKMSSKHNNTCAGCLNTFLGKEFLKCRTCNGIYDLTCANVSEKRFHSFYGATSKEKTPWVCPGCQIKLPRGDNSKTPVRREPPQEDNTDYPKENITLRHKPKPTSNTGPSMDMDVNLQRLIQATIRAELSPIKVQLSALQESVDYVSKQYDDIIKTTNALVDDYKNLKTECAQLRTTVTTLSDRLNVMEQHQRDTNIEIQGAPQHKNENVVQIVKKIADVITLKINDTDILNCTRVASINKDSKRPRAIVVKLRSTRCRDEFYSAVTRYNKSNPNNKLCSSLLGLSGHNAPIYVSEHLSPSNKALHAATRARAKELSYKFVWVRNGRIFMRKNETSPFIHVRNEQSLHSIVN